MAVGANARSSTNPFDDPDDGAATPEQPEQPASSPTPSATVLPFIRVPILITCTILVFILLIAGTATTVLSFPPQTSNRKTNPPLDGDYKILGPLLISAGCFLLCVDVALCTVVTREAYNASRAVQPVGRAWNIPRPAPVAFVGGPFYIATTDPATLSIHPPFTSLQFGAPWWARPNAPHMDPMGMPDLGKGTRRESSGMHQQPPYNPDIVETFDGA